MAQWAVCTKKEREAKGPDALDLLRIAQRDSSEGYEHNWRDQVNAEGNQLSG